MDFYLDDENAINRLKEEWIQHGKIIVAVDYDDTLFDFHNKGRTYTDVINLLKRVDKLGAYFVIFTTCNENQYDDITEYLNKNNIRFDKINENLDFIPFTGRKIYYNILLDDRAGLSSSYYQLLEVVEQLEEERN